MIISTNLFVGILEKELMERRTRNPSYSIRSFARDIEIDQSALTRILKRERPVTAKTFNRIAKHLRYTKSEVEMAYTISFGGSTATFQPMELDAFLAASEWFYDAIMEATKLRQSKPDAAWLAARFGLTEAAAQSAVERLMRLNILKEENGRWIDAEGGNQILADHQTHESLKKYQADILAKSQDALKDLPPVERSHTSLIFVGDRNKISEAKKRIHAFRRELMDFMGEPNAKNELNEVYCVHVGLFPLNEEIEKISKES